MSAHVPLSERCPWCGDPVFPSEEHLGFRDDAGQWWHDVHARAALPVACLSEAKIVWRMVAGEFGFEREQAARFHAWLTERELDWERKSFPWLAERARVFEREYPP